MADLLLELFSEEIPARMQGEASRNLQKFLVLDIGAAGFGDLSACPCKTFVTPRRLAILIQNIPTLLPDSVLEVKGPRVGTPEAALNGFLKKNNLERNQLEEREGVYYATIHRKGRPTIEILKPLIEEFLKAFTWPKSMRWGAYEQAWVRPLHNILCLFDDDVVPVQFAHMEANNHTFGHRFLSPKQITVKKADEYEKLLEKAHVIADATKRKEMIREQAEAVAKKRGLSVKQDEGLLEEVVGLVEWPVVLMGNIDEEYMGLPPEVLISEMKSHQRYFALLNKDGSLPPHFLITSNMETSDGGKAVVTGNERVLRARFADGKFFWEQDRKTKLEDWAKKLGEVTFHAKLGMVAQKVERVTALAEHIADVLQKDPHPTLSPQGEGRRGVAKPGEGEFKQKVQRAAQLCKADLPTGMVGEFPELQGVMGRYYALAQGEDKEVADAIREHYQPLGPDSPVPAAPVSICVALADKLDTLVSMFAIGEKPTGSKDPFALRRAALGVIRIVLENKIRLPLSHVFNRAPFKEIALHRAHEKLVRKAEAHLRENPGKHKVGKYLTVNETASEEIPEDAAEQLSESLLSFFHDRLIVQLKDSGIRHDVIRAVTASGDDDLWRVAQRAKALQDFILSQDGANLLTAYRRTSNILTAEQKKGTYTQGGSFSPAKLEHPEEKNLWKEYNAIFTAVHQAMEKENFTYAMQEFAKLRKPVDAFFNKVLVNDPDPELRKNRLDMLNQISRMYNLIADFSLIEGGDEVKKAA